MRTALDQAIPIERVLRDANAFLEECGWELEIGKATVQISKTTDFHVRSRMFIAAEDPQIALGDHWQALVMLGGDVTGAKWHPKHGYLKIHYSTRGEFISATADDYAIDWRTPK